MTLWRRILRAGPDELSLQDAIYELLRRSPIRMSQIADRTGIPFSTLRTYTVDPDHASDAYRAMPVYAIPPITNATGNDVLLDALEAACGRVGIRVPEVTEPATDLLAEVAEVAHDFGTLATTVAAALRDRCITPAECATIHDEGYRLIQHVLRTMAAAATPAPAAAER